LLHGRKRKRTEVTCWVVAEQAVVVEENMKFKWIAREDLGK
jgi:hypothetical protein